MLQQYYLVVVARRAYAALTGMRVTLAECLILRNSNLVE
jgi:hypothetical protein